MDRGEDQATGSEASRTGGDGSRSTTEAVRDLERVEPGELVDVLGISPEECLFRLVEEHEGRLPQERLVELVPWSAPTVSRLLSTLEEQHRVVRIHAGRGKMVFLVGQSPDP